MSFIPSKVLSSNRFPDSFRFLPLLSTRSHEVPHEVTLEQGLQTSEIVDVVFWIIDADF